MLTRQEYDRSENPLASQYAPDVCLAGPHLVSIHLLSMLHLKPFAILLLLLKIVYFIHKKIV